MTREPVFGASQDRSVLHGVVLSDESRALGRRPMVSAANRAGVGGASFSSKLGSASDLGAPVLEEDAALKLAPEILEAAREAGRQQGFKEGVDLGKKHGFQQCYEDAFQQAEQKGRQAGLQASEKATQHANAVLNERAQRVETILSALSEQCVQRLQAVEDDMVALCFEAVCRVIGELLATPEGVRQHLLTAMASLNSRASVSVHMHPDDLWLLKQSYSTGEASNPQLLSHELVRLGHMQVKWVADPTITLGGCMLRTSEGGLDAQVKLQLQALGKSLLATRTSRQTVPSVTAVSLAHRSNVDELIAKGTQ